MKFILFALVSISMAHASSTGQRSDCSQITGCDPCRRACEARSSNLSRSERKEMRIAKRDARKKAKAAKKVSIQ